MDDGELQYEGESEGFYGGAVGRWLGNLGADACPGEDVSTGGHACFVLVGLAVSSLLSLAFECGGDLPGA